MTGAKRCTTRSSPSPARTTTATAEASTSGRKFSGLSGEWLGVRGKDAGRPDSPTIGATEDAATGGETPPGSCRTCGRVYSAQPGFETRSLVLDFAAGGAGDRDRELGRDRPLPDVRPGADNDAVDEDRSRDIAVLCDRAFAQLVRDDPAPVRVRKKRVVPLREKSDRGWCIGRRKRRPGNVEQLLAVFVPEAAERLEDVESGSEVGNSQALTVGEVGVPSDGVEDPPRFDLDVTVALLEVRKCRLHGQRLRFGELSCAPQRPQRVAEMRLVEPRRHVPECGPEQRVVARSDQVERPAHHRGLQNLPLEDRAL